MRWRASARGCWRPSACSRSCCPVESPRCGAICRLAVGALFWLPHASDVAAAAVFFTFFASFPRRMIHSTGRLGCCCGCRWRSRVVKPLQFAFDVVYAPEHATGDANQGQLLTIVTGLYIVAALTALTMNYRRLTDVNERRRVKVLVVGALGGLAPGFLVVASYWLRSSANLTESIFASRATALGTVSLLFFPTAFAYAILRHRLFDIRVIIRQGVQYALARRVLDLAGAGDRPPARRRRAAAQRPAGDVAAARARLGLPRRRRARARRPRAAARTG